MQISGDVTKSVTDLVLRDRAYDRPNTGAWFDQTGAYRYSLWRIWGRSQPIVVFIMLNPSTADAERNDPTIRRCCQFAKDWGYGGIEIVNLFSFRTPHPRLLRQAAKPIGPDTDRAIQQAIAGAAQVIVAWGNAGAWRGRDRHLLQTLSAQPLYCLGTTQAGHPKHPLYLPKTTPRQRFGAP